MTGRIIIPRVDPLAEACRTLLPGVPANRIGSVITAANTAASGQAFTAFDVLSALNADRGCWILSDGFCKSSSDGSGGFAAVGDPVGWVGSISQAGGSNLIQATTASKPTQAATGCTFDGTDDRISHSVSTTFVSMVVVASAPSYGSSFPGFNGLISAPATQQGYNGSSGTATFESGNGTQPTLMNGVSTSTYLPASSLKVLSSFIANRSAWSGVQLGRDRGIAGREWAGEIAFAWCSSRTSMNTSTVSAPLELMVRRWCNAFFGIS